MGEVFGNGQVESRTAPDRWSWLKIALSGTVLFLLMERTYAATNDILYLPSLLLLGAATIPLSFWAFLYSRAKTPIVPWQSLLICTIWGGGLGTILAGQLEYKTIQNLGALPTIAIGVIEELAKLAVPLVLFLGGRYRSYYDGVIIGAAAGLGFAILESMGYGLVTLLLTNGSVTFTGQVLLLRGLMAPAAHIAWTGLLAGALWQTRDQRCLHRFRQLFITFLGVVLLHALWDSTHLVLGYVVLGLFSLSWLGRRILRQEYQPEQVVDELDNALANNKTRSLSV